MQIYKYLHLNFYAMKFQIPVRENDFRNNCNFVAVLNKMTCYLFL